MPLTLKSLLTKLQSIKTQNNNLNSRGIAKIDGTTTLESLLSVEGSNYSSYTCQLFQTGTNNAYDNVLGEHGLSDYILWERLDVGLYRGTLINAFPEFKTFLVYSGLVLNPISGLVTSPPDPITYNIISVERVDNDTLLVTQVDSELAAIDGLESFCLEIRIYEDNTLRD